MSNEELKIPVKRFQLNPELQMLVEAPPKLLFLRGPIPMDWLSKAADLPGKTLHLALALWWLKGMSKVEAFKLTRKALTLLHISRDATRDGLNRLEQQGLIRVERKTGQSHVITIRND